MPSAEENLKAFQEIADLGLQDQLTPENRAIFDRVVGMGLININLPSKAKLFQHQAADELAEDTGPFESFVIATGRGLTDIGRAFGLADPEDEATKISFDALENQRPITQTIGRATGQSLPFIAPGMQAGAIASTPIRIGAATAVGATEGGLIAKGTGEETAYGAGIGGAVAGISEALFPYISRIGRKLWHKIKGKPPSRSLFDPTGRPTKEFLTVLDESGVTIDDLSKHAQDMLDNLPEGTNPAEAARLAQFDELDVPPLKAQVTRGADDFQKQQEAFKTSTRVRRALEDQEGLLVNRFDDAIAGTGGNAVTSGSPIVDTVINMSTELDNKISDLYQVAKNASSGAEVVNIDRFAALLKKSAPTNRITKGLISAIKGDLMDKGLIDKNFKILKQTDVGTAEEVRKYINTFFNSTSPFGKIKMRALKEALDNDVFTAAGEDIFKEARLAKFNFEKMLRRAKVSKFDSRKANLVRDVLENKVNPDEFMKDVVTSKKWRADDLRQLKDFAEQGNPKAWQDLRAETMDFIKQSSFIGPEDAMGNRAITRASLERTLNKIGKEKMSVLFSSKEMKFIKDVINVTRLREPVRGTALGKGPSAQAVLSIEKRLEEMPFVGAIVRMIDWDAQGRAVIKSSPKPILPPYRLEKVIPGSVSTPAIAGILQPKEDKQPNGTNQ